ncbi:hypothetical protein GBAR_LOCUS18976, partial [Geodia barretti]
RSSRCLHLPQVLENNARNCDCFLHHEPLDRLVACWSRERPFVVIVRAVGGEKTNPCGRRYPVSGITLMGRRLIKGDWGELLPAYARTPTTRYFSESGPEGATRS